MYDGFMTYLVSTDKVRVSGVDITGLHTVTLLVEAVGILRQTHETRSCTSLSVGVIDFLKKLTTTWLNRSRKAGYRLNACYRKVSTICQSLIENTNNLAQKLAKNTY